MKSDLKIRSAQPLLAAGVRLSANKIDPRSASLIALKEISAGLSRGTREGATLPNARTLSLLSTCVILFLEILGGPFACAESAEP